MRRFALVSALCALLACGRSAAPNGGDPADGVELTPPLQHELARGPVFINEVLANEPGFDASQEFVELVNSGATEVDLSGWTVSDNSTVRHVFPTGTRLAPGGVVVVTGQTASTGKLSLGNSGDGVHLGDSGGLERDVVRYGVDLARVDGVSLNRSPDGQPEGPLQLHTSLSSLPFSPGTRADGSPFEGPPPLPDPADAGAPDAGSSDEPDAGEAFSLRLVSGNISSGRQQSYDSGEGIRIFQALRPDVALVQEANYGANTDADLRAFVDQAFGAGFFYARETGAQIPNAIVSRWPIIASGQWNDRQATNRDFTWARIDVPGPKDLWAVSVHFLTSNGSTRLSEANEVVAQIEANIPESDYLVFGGDLNTGSRSEGCVNKLGQILVVNGPYPVDGRGNGNTNRGRKDPYDWVLVDRDLTPHQVPTRLGSRAFPNGLVFDSREFSPLEDAAPVLSGDSGSMNMQHMAVTRDFLVPAR